MQRHNHRSIMSRSRSEYQSRTRLGWQRRHDVDDIIVIWQTFVISSTSAVPGLVEEGAKTEDLKHGADQSGLLENLRLSSAVQHDSLLPERSCLAAHPPQAAQDGVNLLVGGQLEQALGVLQA